ncbi:MAG: putative toxin-antitoxin system toxin component, PIN family [Bacteroidetes bacterium]|jgi:putative PIN family toxin of toxin-antitoxin system|nr:putative toxin-antitoxin system toxin component, PIN family [Bacteroidota bacterium]
MKPKRIILDTNLWISFLISKKFKLIDELIKQHRVILVFSEESINEFLEVANRPKFKKYFSKSDIVKLIKHFDKYGILIKVTSDINICRDKKDNFLLNLAKDSNAEFLVTGDYDLLVLEKIDNTQIITFENFKILMN